MSALASDLYRDPVSAFVYPHALKEFLDVVGAVSVVTTKGRCIHVRRKSGFFPSFGELAPDLIGWNRPCDEFRVSGSSLYARLKTIGQRCADNDAGAIDELFGEFGLKEATAGITTYGLGDFGDGPRASRGPKRNKLPEGAATFVMKAMAREVPVGAIEIDKLIEITSKIMPPKKDKEGKNRSAKYIRQAIEKLVELEILHLHEGTKVSLSTAVVGDA